MTLNKIRRHEVSAHCSARRRNAAYTSRTTSGSINVLSSFLSSLQHTCREHFPVSVEDDAPGVVVWSMGHTGVLRILAEVSPLDGRLTIKGLKLVVESFG